jgi:hypothetical protein
MREEKGNIVTGLKNKLPQNRTRAGPDRLGDKQLRFFLLLFSSCDFSLANALVCTICELLPQSSFAPRNPRHYRPHREVECLGDLLVGMFLQIEER